MPSHLTIGAVLVAVAPLSGCYDNFGPASDLVVLVSASPDFVEAGDTVELVGVAYNGSRSVIEASSGCEPGIGFTVADSAGTETDLYAGLNWNCPGRDSNVLEPGETDTVDWSWIPPGPGTYTVRSVVPVRGGPTIRSRAAEVRVVERP